MTELQDTEFEMSWILYPKKVAKVKARSAYMDRLDDGVSAADLLSATAQYASERKGEQDQYTFHGATFYGPQGLWKEALERANAAAGQTNKSYGAPNLGLGVLPTGGMR